MKPNLDKYNIREEQIIKKTGASFVRAMELILATVKSAEYQEMRMEQIK